MGSEKIAEGVAQAAGGGLGVGGGIWFVRWFILWLSARHDSKQAALDAQDERIDQEWKKIREELKAEVGAIRRQNEALRFAFHHVAGALIRLDPRNPALIQAEQLLAQAFPIDLQMVADRAAAALDRSEEERLTRQGGA
jgi:hypothetical protein